MLEWPVYSRKAGDYLLLSPLHQLSEVSYVGIHHAIERTSTLPLVSILEEWERSDLDVEYWPQDLGSIEYFAFI